MYGDWCTMAWINGLSSFLDAAEADRSSKGFMWCPCRTCRNNKEFSRRSTLHVHLIERGFMNNYTLWSKHVEPGVLMEDDEDADDDNNIPDLAHLYEAGAFDDEPIDKAEENIIEEQPHDELGQVLLDAYKDSDTVKESNKFEKMLDDHKMLLYPDCK
jgi:capsule polysaccharide export protein KpsC/LpsZ